MLRNGLKRVVARPELVARLATTKNPRVVVLMYHDLRRDEDFANWLRVSVSEFERQLVEFRKLGDFITPQQAEHLDDLPADRLHFLVTFDDGYLNNWLLARPLLAKHEVPALFFVSTGPLTDRNPFWSDVIATPIQALGLEEIDLSEHDLGRFRFRRGDDDARWSDVDHLLRSLKSVGNEDHPTVAAVLASFRRDYASTLEEHLPRFAPISEAQVRDFVDDPWCHLGSHGHAHRVLTRLNDEELAHSLHESRHILTELGVDPVSYLAYPNGDHDGRVAAAARAAGYRMAWTVAPGIMDSSCEAMAIPRFGVSGTSPLWSLQFQLARELLKHRWT